jgi:hypothetical protein
MKAAKKKIVQNAITIVPRSLIEGLLKALLKEFTRIYILFTSRLQLALPLMRTFGYANQSYCFMKHLKRSITLLMLLTLIIGSRTSAQVLSLEAQLEKFTQDRGNEVVQDNEYTNTGYESGNFLSNPLLLDGKPLNYTDFSLATKGELTVIKEAAVTGKTTPVAFYVYLRRNGISFFIPGKKRSDLNRIEISEILRFAKKGDQLIIEAVNKEDGAVKRILKLPGDGC